MDIKERIQKCQKDCAIITNDDLNDGTAYAAGYNYGLKNGIMWADTHPQDSIAYVPLYVLKNILATLNMCDKTLATEECCLSRNIKCDKLCIEKLLKGLSLTGSERVESMIK